MNIFSRWYASFCAWIVRTLTGQPKPRTRSAGGWSPNTSQELERIEARTKKRVGLSQKPSSIEKVKAVFRDPKHDREKIEAAAQKRARRNAKRAQQFYGVK